MNPIKIIKDNLFIIITIALLISFHQLIDYRYGTESGTVDNIFDGDTILLDNGKVVRYAIVDTPERGEPLYEEARIRNKELVLGKTVVLKKNSWRNKDVYNRYIRLVYVDGQLVDDILIEENLGKFYKYEGNTKNN